MGEVEATYSLSSEAPDLEELCVYLTQKLDSSEKLNRLYHTNHPNVYIRT